MLHLNQCRVAFGRRRLEPLFHEQQLVVFVDYGYQSGIGHPQVGDKLVGIGRTGYKVFYKAGKVELGFYLHALLLVLSGLPQVKLGLCLNIGDLFLLTEIFHLLFYGSQLDRDLLDTLFNENGCVVGYHVFIVSGIFVVEVDQLLQEVAPLLLYLTLYTEGKNRRLLGRRGYLQFGRQASGKRRGVGYSCLEGIGFLFISRINLVVAAHIEAPHGKLEVNRQGVDASVEGHILVLTAYFETFALRGEGKGYRCRNLFRFHVFPPDVKGGIAVQFVVVKTPAGYLTVGGVQFE